MSSHNRSDRHCSRNDQIMRLTTPLPEDRPGSCRSRVPHPENPVLPVVRLRPVVRWDPVLQSGPVIRSCQVVLRGR